MAMRLVTKTNSLLSVPSCPPPQQTVTLHRNSVIVNRRARERDRRSSLMAGTEGLSREVGQSWGGGTKAFCCSVGVQLPALLCTLGLRFHIWRGANRLRCSFRDKRGLFVEAQHPPEPGYKVTHIYGSAGNRYCKKTGLFPAGPLCANFGWSCRRHHRHCPHRDARLLPFSRWEDFSSPNKRRFHSTTLMLTSLVDLFEECKPS